MLKWIILVLFLGASLSGITQDFSADPNPAESKLSFSYGMGVAMPTGRFGSYDVTTTNAGFAKSALQYRFRLQAKPSPFWLVGLQVNYASHSFNTEPFDNIIANDTIFLSWESDNWNTFRVLGEIGGVLHHGPIDLNGRLLLGMTRTTYPKNSSVQNISGTLYQVIDDADPAVNLTVGAGFSFHYKFKRLFFGGYVDYLYTETDYVVVTSVAGLGPQGSSTYDQPLGVLGLGLQIGLHY